MTMFEDRLQVALHDLAEDTGPAPVTRWAAQVPPHPAARTRALAVHLVAAAVVVVLVAVAAVVVVRRDPPSVVEPVEQPPRVVHLSGTTSSAPGPAVLAFTLGPLIDGSGGPAREPGHLAETSGVSAGYLVGRGPSGAVALPEEALIRPVANFSRPQLSTDGLRYLLQVRPSLTVPQDYHPPAIILVTLATGRRDRLGGAAGFCAELSPDSGTVAYLDRGVRLLDVRSRTSRPVVGQASPRSMSGCAGGIGWAPDGRSLAVARPAHPESGDVDRTRVVTLEGRTVHEFPGRPVNGSMSWSPDGAALLLYTPQTGRYTVGRLDGTRPTTLSAPRDVFGVVGWAGSRVVWLLGGAGDQRLVTTDVAGGDLQLWTRFDVGDRPLTSIQWSRDLAGTGAR